MQFKDFLYAPCKIDACRTSFFYTQFPLFLARNTIRSATLLPADYQLFPALKSTQNVLFWAFSLQTAWKNIREY